MKSMFLLGALLASSSAIADVAVIVHPSNSSALDAGEISKIFLGRAKSFSSGESAVPVNLPEGDALYAEFTEKALNKSASQVKAYWAKLIFTGKGTPPHEATSEQDAVKLVANNPNMIAYVDPSKADGSVKVVATF